MTRETLKPSALRRRWRVWVVAALLALTPLTLYVGRGLFFAPLLRILVVRTVEDQLGVKISIEEIGGSWLGTLELHGIETLAADPDQPIQQLTATLLSARYSLQKAIFGSDRWLESLTLTDARLEIDLTRGVASAAAGNLPNPTQLPELSLNNLSLRLHGPDLDFSIQGLELSARDVQRAGSKLTLRAPDLSYHWLGARRDHVAVYADLVYRSGKVQVRELSFDEVPVVKHLDVDLQEWASDRFGVVGDLSAFGSNLALTGNFDQGKLEGDVSLQRLDLARLLSQLGFAEAAVAGSLDLEGELHLVLDAPADGAGKLRLALDNGSFDGRFVKHLDAQLELKDGVFYLPTLRIEQPGGRLHVTEAKLPDLKLDDPLDLLSRADGRLSLEVFDVPLLFESLALPWNDERGLLPPQHRLRLEGSWQPGLRGDLHGTLVLPDLRIDLDEASVSFDAELPSLHTSSVYARARLKVDDLSRYAQALALPTLKGSLEGDLAADGVLAALPIEAVLYGHDIVLLDRPLGEVMLHAYHDGRTLRLETLDLTGSHHHLQAQGAFELDTRRLDGCQVHFQIEDLAELLGQDFGIHGKLQGELRGGGWTHIPDATFDLTLQDGLIGGLSILSARLRGTLRGTNLDVQALELELPGTSLTLASPTRLRFSADSCHLEPTVLHTQNGRILLEGSWESGREVRLHVEVENLETGDWSRGLLPESLAVNRLAQLTVQVRGDPANPHIEVASRLEDLHLAGLRLESLSLEAEILNRELIVHGLRVHADGRERLRVSGRAPFDVTKPRRLPEGELEGLLELDWQDVQGVGPHGSQWSGDRLAGTLEVSGTWSEPRGEGSLTAQGLRLPLELDDEPAALHAEAQLVLDQHGLQLPMVSVHARDLELTATAGWGLRWPPAAASVGTSFTDAPFLGHVQASLSDLRRLRTLLPGLTQLAGQAHVDLEMEGSLSGLRWTGRVDLDELEGRLAGTPEEATFTGNGRFRLDRFAIVRTEPEASAQVGPLFGWQLHGRVEVVELTLAALGGRIEAAGHLSGEGEHSLVVHTRRLGLEPLLRPYVPADLVLGNLAALELRIQGEATKPRFTSHAMLRDVRVAGLPPAQIEVDLAWQDDLLHLQRGMVEIGGEPVLEASGRLPLALFSSKLLAAGPLDLGATARIESFAELLADVPDIALLAGSATATATVLGEWSAPRVRLTLDAEQLRVDSEQVPLPAEPLAVFAEVALGSVGLELSRLGVRAEGYTLDAAGLYAVQVNVERWLAGEVPDWDCPVQLGLRLHADDTRWVAGAWPALHRTAGILDLEIFVAGTPSAPNLEGTASLREGEIRFASTGLPAFHALQADAELRWDGMHLHSVFGELGAAPFQGRADLHWRSGEPLRLEAALQGEELLLYRARGIKLRADTQLELEGPLDQMVLRGTLDVTDGRYVKSIDLISLSPQADLPSPAEGIELFSLQDGPFATMRFEVTMTTKNPIQIHNNLLHGSIRTALELRGTGEFPLLLGDLYINPTTVKLPASNLRISSGVIQFQETNPYVPIVEINAGNRMQGYDIQVLVTGPYDDPEIHLSSTPPLPDRDLLVLLSTGQSPKTELDVYSREGALSTIAVYLGRDLLVRWLGDESTEAGESVLDRLEIETGRDITRNGTETIEARFRLLDGLLIDQDELYLVAEKDAYEDFNGGLKLVFRFR